VCFNIWGDPPQLTVTNQDVTFEWAKPNNQQKQHQENTWHPSKLLARQFK
jgi:hypothetical protein